MSPTAPAVLRFPTEAGGELALALPELQLVGTSIAALATAFAVDRFQVAVDMGRCSALLAAQDTVLLTHCHADHVAGLIAWLSAHTRRFRNRPTTIAVPAERRDQLVGALAVWPDLDGVRRRVDLEQVVVGCRPGTVLQLASGASARALEAVHNTAAVGWALLAPDSDRPLIAFTGDGTAEPFRQRPELLDAATVVVDCSFVAPGHRLAARLSAHGHLQDWIELGPTLRCDRLVLAHLPHELGADTLTAALAGAFPATLEVVPWLRTG